MRKQGERVSSQNDDALRAGHYAVAALAAEVSTHGGDCRLSGIRSPRQRLRVHRAHRRRARLPRVGLVTIEERRIKAFRIAPNIVSVISTGMG